MDSGQVLKSEQDKVFKKALIVGLGKTGLSCARFLAQYGYEVAIADSREAPPALDALRDVVPNAAVFLGEFDPKVFEMAETIILSPGVSPQETLISQAQARGIPVIGDVEVFARFVQAPVIGITGSNGKSTVTTLTADLLEAAGYSVGVGGNLGTPALDLLLEDKKDVYVLELSSFQLETTSSLNCAAAVVLNISPDHIDRHGSLAAYSEAKERIFQGSGSVVINDDMPALDVDLSNRKIVRYGVSNNDVTLGVRMQGDEEWIVDGQNALLPVSQIKLQGRHNLSNVLAALSLLKCLGVSLPSVVEALKAFAGLPHRMQFVASYDDVTWINDSKGTNVGATVAALSGLAGNVILIAGGQSKGADFSPLEKAVEKKAKAVILIGQDASQIEKALESTVTVKQAQSMDEAVETASQMAVGGDVVLLSPACASFDMFKDFEDRGNAFIKAVHALYSTKEHA